MVISSLLAELLGDLSEENYDHTFSVYRFWIGLGAAHGGMSINQLYKDILNSTKPDLIRPSRPEPRQSNARPDLFAGLQTQLQMQRNALPGSAEEFSGKLIHDSVHLLLRFISDAEPDPVLSTYAIGLHDRLCREALEEFFRQSLCFIPGRRFTQIQSQELSKFYKTL